MRITHKMCLITYIYISYNISFYNLGHMGHVTALIMSHMKSLQPGLWEDYRTNNETITPSSKTRTAAAMTTNTIISLQELLHYHDMSYGKPRLYTSKISWTLTGWKYLVFLSYKFPCICLYLFTYTGNINSISCQVKKKYNNKINDITSSYTVAYHSHCTQYFDSFWLQHGQSLNN